MAPSAVSDELSSSTGSPVADRYLDLMRDCLTRRTFTESWYPVLYQKGTWRNLVIGGFHRLVRSRGYRLCWPYKYSAASRAVGDDWPPEAETMIGLARLENVRRCCISVVRDGIPGDFCETGVWRGGTCIFMRAILEALNDRSRRVWVCDSFEGLPKASHPADLRHDATGQKLAQLWSFEELAVSLDQVKSNFEKYDLLDDRVRFLKGWFRDSLPNAPIERLSVLRLDGDLYESTWDALINLYSKLSPGGYLIVDDYGIIEQCRDAVHDFRAKHGITEPIEKVDQSGVFWRRVH